jgi:hypothetical protein
MFSYISPEERVPREHPLRSIRAMVDAVLKELSALFDQLYSDTGAVVQARYASCSEPWWQALEVSAHSARGHF